MVDCLVFRELSSFYFVTFVSGLSPKRCLQSWEAQGRLGEVLRRIGNLKRGVRLKPAFNSDPVLDSGRRIKDNPVPKTKSPQDLSQ